MTKERSAYELS